MIDRAITDFQPAIRFPLRAANATLGLFERLGLRKTSVVDRREVIRIAAKLSGIEDFDYRELGEPLQMLCDTANDPRFTPLARLQRKNEIVTRLTNRLCLEKALREDPGIIREPVERPWFIMGLPRTGTTLLHRLLAQDPGHRAPLLWETATPFPRDERDTAQRRRNRMKSATKVMYYLAPELKSKHELDADEAEECNLLLANSLVGGVWVGRSDKFNDWFSGLDRTRAYQVHKLQLQYLQRNTPRRTWILKDPDHLTHLQALLKVYPDARIVQLHRDPTEVLPSCASLLALLEAMVLWQVDPHDVGRKVYDWAKDVCYAGFNTQEGRASYLARGVRVVDVRYSDLIKDPLATVAGIYQRFDCGLSGSAQRRMREYLLCNPQHKYGAHKYTPEQFGLNVAQIRDECAWYVDRYLMKPAFH